MATQTHISIAQSEQSEIFQEFMTAMERHQTNLRLDINQMEVIVGCIAKSTDEQVVQYLPDANLSISNLRECLLTLQVHWRIFKIKHGSIKKECIDMTRSMRAQQPSPRASRDKSTTK